MNEPHFPTSRRTMLKTAAALAAGAVLPRGAAAQPQSAGGAKPAQTPVQGGGFYRMTLGDAEITLIADGGFVADDANAFFKGDSGDAVNKALTERHLKPAKLQMFVNTLLVKKGGKTTLIDAGTGGQFGPGAGFLFDRLAAIGTLAESIDTVVLTHAHGDHYGGLLDAAGKPRLPNAELLVSEAEYDFWTKSPDLSKSGMPPAGHAAAIKQQQDLFAALKFTRVAVAGDKELRPGITAVATPGHTPGHLSILVDGGGNDQLFYNTDLIHHVAIMLPHPEFKVAFDTDREAAAETRKKSFARLAADKMLVSGTHVPFPGFGYVEKAGEGYEWRPAMWQW
jgi:glyoxylase-like metal-dependent hydrolase (beta-lactamase superfamily II)